MPDDPQVQSGEDQGQQTPAAPAAAPAPPAAPPVGSGPWAADLAGLGLDETGLAKVDSFLREKIQPHTTQLEQKLAAQQDAAQLWSQLEDDPHGVAVSIVEQLYGPEIAQQLAAIGQQGEPEPAPQPGEPQYDPRLAAALEYIENQQAQAIYDSEMSRIQQAHPEVQAELLDPFVHAAEGDFDTAYAMYVKWASQIAPAPAAPTPAPAPPVTGSDSATAAPASVPAEPKKQTLDEAINDFMAESRANREAPPVLG